MVADDPLAFSTHSTDERRSVVLRLCLCLLASGVFTGALFTQAAPGKILATIGRSRPEWLAAALLAIAISFAIRIRRWTVLLRSSGLDVRFRDAAVPMMGSVALNNLLPFRAGDAIRLIALRSFTGRTSPRQIGALVLERLIDLHVLVVIVLATVLLWRPGPLGPGLMLLLEVAAVAVIAAPLGFVAAPWGGRFAVRWMERLAPGALPPGHTARAVYAAVYESVRDFSKPALLARIVGLSYAAWLFEGAGFIAVGMALDMALPARTGALAVGIATLSTGIPSLPGYVGTFDYFAAAAAAAYGSAPADAVAYAIIVHALLWLLGTAAGWGLLMSAERIGVARGPAHAVARSSHALGGR